MMRYILALMLLCFALWAKAQTKNNVGIGTTTPDASAVLDISATNKGVLFPRMTTTERNSINTPTTGLLIYNTTDNKFNFYNGTTWVVLDDITLGGNVVRTNLASLLNKVIPAKDAKSWLMYVFFTNNVP